MSTDVRSVRFRDLRVDDPVRKAELLDAVDRVLTHGRLLMGGEVETFERAVAEYCGTSYCVGVSSGTDALYMALRAAGVGPSDEVITTPLSWIATLNAIHLCGATAVFVDVRDDLNIDPALIEGAITPRTKAVVPVHFTGRVCDMDAIIDVAGRHGLTVVEDAAQAFGAHVGGRPAGSFGHVNAFSLNPMKVLAGYGEAGAVTTNDGEVYEALLALRYLGTVNKEVCYYPSLNFKIDTLQAAMLLVSLKYVENAIKSRLRVAAYYEGALSGVVRTPVVPRGAGRRDVFFDFTVRADRRDGLQQYLTRCGVETKVKHPILMPDQPAYAHLPRGSIPVADRLVSKILCLPIHEKLTDDELAYIVSCVKDFYRGER
jgi:dTDP-4-amino-4,6-dideoxygalactose transaminase